MVKQVPSFRWRSFLAYGGAFFLAGLGWMVFKHLQLEHLTGLKLLARVLHRADGAFSRWELMGLYGADIVLGLLVVPLAAGLLAAQQRVAGMRPLLSVLLLTDLLLLHADMAAFANVSTLLSWEMIREAAAWARDDPAIIPHYVTPRTWLKILLSTVGLLGLMLWLDRARWSWPKAPAGWRLLSQGGALVAGIALVVLLASLQPMASYPQSSAALTRAVLALMPDPEPEAFRQHDLAQLQRDFCAVSDSPCPSPAATPDRVDPIDAAGTAVAAAVAGKAGAGAGRLPAPAPRDVILFIMETAPADFFDLPTLLAEDPLLHEWSRRAWIAKRHYATFPYTSDATFSLLSGLYPEGRRAWLQCRDSQPLGWVEALRRAGHATRHYAPTPDSFEADSLMFSRLGLPDRYIAEEEAAGRDAAAARLDMLRRQRFPDTTSPLPEKAVLDQQAFDRLLGDMAAWQRESRPYVAVFAPQIGHGPWPDLRQREGTTTLQERATTLGQLQMAWLHEIVAQLRRSGRLERTLLILTADHGLRTQTEFPDIPAGWLTGISSHVPLLVHDGGRPLPFDDQQVSSHVDIGPTVLQRLGMPVTQAFMEGLPLGDPGLARRRTYMLGVGYLGAELMHQHGRFLAHAPIRQACESATTDNLAGAELQPHARCQAVFEPLRAVHLEAMKRLCVP